MFIVHPRLFISTLSIEIDKVFSFTCKYLSAATSARSDQFPFPEPLLNNPRGTADTGINCYGGYRTVFGTGAAFHAGVSIHKSSLPVTQGKNLMGAYFQTSVAAYAGRTIKFYGRNIA
jgi:hypothetical protein